MPANSKTYYATICRLLNAEDTTRIELEPNSIMLGTPFELTQEHRVNARGKEYERVIVHDSTRRVAGFLPKDVTNRVIRLFDEGWLCHVVPMLIGYSKKDKAYWVEASVVCYPPEHKQELDTFFSAFCRKVAAGEHPDPRLTDKQLELVLESGGTWCEVDIAPRPKLDRDNAIYKSRQTNTEKLAQTAIAHTTGCYIVLAVVTLLVAAFVVWLLFLR
mgnify:CR=1 FL=1